MHRIYETKLARAATEQEVVGIVRDYVRCWAPEDLRRIPAGCLPGKIRDAEALADCAFDLTLERIHHGNPSRQLVEMEAFFALACARVSKLEGAALKRAQYALLVERESLSSSSSGD